MTPTMTPAVHRAGVVLVMAFSLTTTTAQSNEISYADCSVPTDVKPYALSEACDQLVPPPAPTEVYQVLQIPTVKRITGTRCTIKQSIFRYTCGSWGHLKTATVPQILHEVPVSAEWCRSMAHSTKCTPRCSRES